MISNKNCRISEQKLIEILNFGNQPLGNGFLKEKDFKNEYFYEMKLGFCPISKMTQLFNQPDPDKMFNDNSSDTSSDSYMSDDISLTKEDILNTDNFNKTNFNKTNLKNEFNSNNFKNNCMKPKDIIIKKNYPLKEFYLNKNKRLKFTKTDILDDKETKISEIIKVPIYYQKEIKFKNKGHNKKQYNEIGDVIFIFDCIENDLFRIHNYQLIYTKNIKISDLYGEFSFDLILPNDKVIKIECNDLYKTDLIIIKESLGLPIPNENKRSNLYIKFNIIYPDLNDENIKIIKKIFS